MTCIYPSFTDTISITTLLVGKSFALRYFSYLLGVYMLFLHLDADRAENEYEI